MRYVGRHRAPRPILLRRPVIGGVAAAVLLAGPVLYATGNFSGAITKGTPSDKIAEAAEPISTPAGAETGTGIVIPTDSATAPTTSPKPGTTAGLPGISLDNGTGVGVGVGVTTRPSTSTSTSKPGSKPTKTTAKPTKTTTKPADPPDEPDPDPVPTTVPPTVDPTDPPEEPDPEPTATDEAPGAANASSSPDPVNDVLDIVAGLSSAD